MASQSRPHKDLVVQDTPSQRPCKHRPIRLQASFRTLDTQKQLKYFANLHHAPDRLRRPTSGRSSSTSQHDRSV